MSLAIQSMHVKRFKGIKDAPFDLSNINVFIGANNSGKSTLAQLLHFGVGILQAIELANRWGKQSTVGLSLGPQELLYSPCTDLYALGFGGQLAEEKDNAIELTITLTDGSKTTLSVRRGRNGNIRVEVENVDAAKKMASVTRPFTIYSPGLAGIAKNEVQIANGVLLRTIARGDANLVLRNILRLLSKKNQKGEEWFEFLEDLGRIFPGIEIEVSYNETVDEHILVYANTGSGQVPIELAGTGVLQALQILGYIHFFHPSAIILDEPDSHLHPNNQRLLCKLLQGVAEERSTQVFLTTHSRHVVDALSGQASFLWVRQAAVEKMKQDQDLAVLLDIGALDVKEMVSGAHSKCVVLTEDAIKAPLEILLEASGFPMKETLTLAYHGCTSPHNLRPLLELIKASNSKAKIVVHRDRDYLDDEEAKRWEEDLRAMGVEPFLTGGVDIESHFLDASHLADVNGIDLSSMTSLLIEATKEVEAISIEKYVNGRSDLAKKTGTFGKLNLGQLAVEAPKRLAAAPERYRHSKTVLKNLRGKFRESYGSNMKSLEVSKHIGVASLMAIVKKL